MSEHLPVFVATFTVATLHSLLPSHWLCFVVIGRTRGWSLRRTLGMTAGAGLAHVLSTIALGIALLAGRRRLTAEILAGQETLIDTVSSGILVGIGLLYLGLHVFRKGHRHAHDEVVGERMAFLSLFLYMTFSPCVPAILIFLGLSNPRPQIVGLLAVLLMASTLGMMMVLVAVSYAGAQLLNLSFADRYEKLIIGATLCLLGLTTYALHRLP